ncbi:MAG: hypothetical protein HY584_00565 [Candidatus Omnitrophica bacterium]|nr:hypothetical protein [Candidatus Omnitrophota bacterium]
MKLLRFILLPAVLLLGFFCSLTLAEQSHLEGLIEKGELLIDQGSYPAGIAILETVLTKDPKNAKALTSLMSACDAYSQKLISESRFDQAQTYLKKMEQATQRIEALPAREFSSTDLKVQSRIKREMVSAKAFLLETKQGETTDIVSLNTGRALYNEAVQSFTKRQFEEAEELLNQSVALDPTNPYAFELLGEIANLNHELDKAESYYKKAFSLNPDPKLREKYEKLIRERGIDKEQQRYSDEHFIIRYRREESFEGSEIREHLRNAYRAVSQDFGHYPKYKIPVLLYGREEYERLMGSVPHWSGAVYDGKIRLPVYQKVSGAGQAPSGFTTGTDLKKFIFHELTHAFVLDLSRMKCPVWLNEGLAQYQENKIQPIDLKALAEAVRTNSLISPEDLLFKDVSKSTSHEEALLFYLESYSLASYLIERNRFYNVKQLLMELGKGTSFPNAFEQVFGRTFTDFASGWLTDLRARYKA